MLTKPIFETLPIFIIAVSLLLIAFVHHPIALLSGLGLIIAGCLMIYRHYTDLATDEEAIDEGNIV